MRRIALVLIALFGTLLLAASCGGGSAIVNPNPNPGGNNPPPGGFDGTFVTPPAETFVDRSAAGATPVEKWLANCYHPLPTPFDTDRVFQNDSLRKWADEILRLTNVQRVNNGLSPLTLDVHLEMVEQAHCRDMALRDFFEHTNPDGLDPFQRLNAVQPPFFTTAGEPNIRRRATQKRSKGFDSAQNWKASFLPWKRLTPFRARFASRANFHATTQSS